ncbi:MAG: DsbA family oxidoreductase [Vitreoscilla sp.]|nr:DsbA family oxidoreductase [Vitreoscilla sp.]
MNITFVSDVVCPWCAIGLASLELALERAGDSLGPIALRFEPFELNPQMPDEGEDLTEHLSRKYGITEDQIRANQASIQERAAGVGFDMRMGQRTRIWNTFDAHRLLHWAGELGADEQRALKNALLAAYFTEGENPGARAVLLRAAAAAGLDAAAAAELLDSGRCADEVREHETMWQQAGIRSVPSIIINNKHLISGGQPPEVFEQALRQIAAQGG